MYRGLCAARCVAGEHESLTREDGCTGYKYWLFVLELLGLLGAFLRSVGTLPTINAVQYFIFRASTAWACTKSALHAAGGGLL